MGCWGLGLLCVFALILSQNRPGELRIRPAWSLPLGGDATANDAAAAAAAAAGPLDGTIAPLVLGWGDDAHDGGAAPLVLLAPPGPDPELLLLA